VFRLTACMVVVLVVPASPLGHLGLIWNSHRKKTGVSRVAGRAGAMRANAQNMPPHVCPRQGRRRPTPSFFTAGEVIDLALVAAYGLKNSSVCPRQGRWMPTPRYCATDTKPYDLTTSELGPHTQTDRGTAPVWGSEFTTNC
jgi:hypothetical protein